MGTPPFHHVYKKHKHKIGAACISPTSDRCFPRRNKYSAWTRSRQQEKGDKSAILHYMNLPKLHSHLTMKIWSIKNWRVLMGHSMYFHINSPHYYNLHKQAAILITEKDGKVMDYLAQRWSLWEGKPKSCTILGKVEANQTNEGRSSSSGVLVSMLFPGATPYTCSTK